MLFRSATGAVMIPMMKKEGYHADYAVNVTTHAALVGALMPTSHNMIIYSLAAGGKVSITALILAGMVPAALLMAATPFTRLVPGVPTITIPEVRRLLEDKSFPIDDMRERLGVEPIGLEEMLARTFGSAGNGGALPA